MELISDKNSKEALLVQTHLRVRRVLRMLSLENLNENFRRDMVESANFFIEAALTEIYGQEGYQSLISHGQNPIDIPPGVEPE